MFISLVELEQLPVYVIWNYEIVNTEQDIFLPNVFSSTHIHTQWLLHRLHHVGNLLCCLRDGCISWLPQAVSEIAACLH